MPEFYHAHALTKPQEGRPHIFLATPASHIYGAHMASVVRAMPLLVLGGLAVDYFLLTGHAHVDDARNTCVGHFLETECEALIFIDADVGFPPEALLRLAMLRGDVVAGCYPLRDPSRTYPFKYDQGAGELEQDEDGVIRKGITGLPTGFMKIHRRVITGICSLEERWFRAAGDGVNGPQCPIIFERHYHEGNRLSGDYAFCQKVRSLGFELALDPHIPFVHEGPWRFGGRLADDMRPKANGEDTKDAA